jgi:tetratricopeptide (TPR) repeat protein
MRMLSGRRAAAFVLVLVLAASGQGLSGQAPGPSARDLVAGADGKRFAEDWYGAVEDYQAALAKNASYSEALVGLAECYYELDEYEEALSYAKKAAVYRRGDLALQDLEGFIKIGLADLPGAKADFTAVASRLPNDLDARFGLALLDLAAGRKTEARSRLEDSLRLSPQNARALLSLALISADQGRADEAEALIERALRFHGQEPRVQYTAARLAMASGDGQKAIFHAKNALSLSPGYSEARSLLGSLMYQTGSYAEAISLMQEGVARNRKDPSAWFTLGLAQEAAGKTADAIYSLRQAVAQKEDDEVARLALENLVMDSSPLESTSREPWAIWHFDKGRELEDRSFFDKAMLEYRRGLSIDPGAKRGRVLYAELLRKRGLPGKHLYELEFLAGLGKADTAVNDSIEIYRSLLQDSVSQGWKTDQYALPKRPYQLAVFIKKDVEDGAHTAGREIILRYLEDLLGASSRLRVADLAPSVSGNTEAFRLARNAGVDYYLLLEVRESERDVLLSGSMRVARTGSLATGFNSYRTGNDRVREATNKLASFIEASLQPKGAILKRSQDSALVDLGSNDGLKAGDKLAIIKKGSLLVAPEGLGPSYPASELIGEFTVSRLDEEVCEGRIKSTEFFDTINSGDELIALPSSDGKAQGASGTAKAGTASSGTAKAPAQTPAPAGSTPAPIEASALFASIRRLR